MVRRHGTPDAFWGSWGDGTNPTFTNTTTSGVSNSIQVGQSVANFVAYVRVNGATTITVQVAPAGPLTADGGDPVNPPLSSQYMTLYTEVAPVQLTFTGPGSAAINIRGFTPGWVRLVSSNAVPALAGYEVTAY